MLPERVWYLPQRCWVTVLGEQAGWVAVRFRDGSLATVPSGTVVTTAPADESGEADT